MTVLEIHLDEEIETRAREIAAARGETLEAALKREIERMAGSGPKMRRSDGHNRDGVMHILRHSKADFGEGFKFSREELYERGRGTWG